MLDARVVGSGNARIGKAESLENSGPDDSFRVHRYFRRYFPRDIF